MVLDTPRFGQPPTWRERFAALSERAEHVLADRRVFPLYSQQWDRFTALLDQRVKSERWSQQLAGGL